MLVWIGPCLGLGAIAHGRIIEDTIKVPVRVQNQQGQVIEQDIVVTVLHDNARAKPYPLLILGHGRSAQAPLRASLRLDAYLPNARWLAGLGFMVALPLRVGYGVTGGEDVENSGPCKTKVYPPGYDASADQSMAVLEFLRQRADTAKDRAVIMGQSYGGTTAVTVAARNPPGVQATINFAGGGGGNPETMPENPCRPDLLEELFANYGKTARVPTLWIYAANDKYFGPKKPREWFDAFKASGGNGQFVQFPPNGADGHPLFTRAPQVWRQTVLSFLRAHGYPALK